MATRWVLLLAAGAVAAAAQPALAQTGIIKSRRSASSTYSPLAAFTIGGGIEYETDDEQTQYDFPLVLEYDPTETLYFSLETAVVHIDGKAEDVRTVTGFDDLETAVGYEFLPERRYTPALTAQGLIRWPTASDEDIGSPGTDYEIGLIASKDIVLAEIDLNLLYTFSGDPEQQDTLEIALAAAYPLSDAWELEAEIVRTIGTDSWRGKLGEEGEPRESGDETELTLGIAWYANDHLTFEQGVTFRDDGSWQVLFGWSWSFGGE